MPENETQVHALRKWNMTIRMVPGVHNKTAPSLTNDGAAFYGIGVCSRWLGGCSLQRTLGLSGGRGLSVFDGRDRSFDPGFVGRVKVDVGFSAFVDADGSEFLQS